MPRKARGQGAVGRRHKRGQKYGRKTELIQLEKAARRASELIQLQPNFHRCSDFFLPNCSNATAVNPYSSAELFDTDGDCANEFYLVADKVIKYSPDVDVNVEDLYIQRMSAAKAKRYSEMQSYLRENSTAIHKDTGFILLHSEHIKLVQIYDGEIPSVKCSITIKSGTADAIITVHRQQISNSHSLWKNIPHTYNTSDDVLVLLETVSQLDVCIGNPDEEFSLMEPGRDAFHEQDFGALMGTLTYSHTIRHKNCELLVSGHRCTKCIAHRGSLRKKKSLEVKKSPLASRDPSALISDCTPHSKLSKKQLCDKVSALQKNRSALCAEIRTLKKKIEKSIQGSIQLSDAMSNEMFKLINECDENIKKTFPDENSFQRLFWAEQLKYNTAKKPSGMRWHPMMIKWCLQVRSRSAKAYETLRNIGCVKLPSSRTLYDYSHFMQSKCGITTDVQNHLIEECRNKGVFDTSWKQYIGLLQDEIKIKEDLVFDKHSGELIGFLDLDKTANQLVELEKNYMSNSSRLASHMLVLMVRGVATDIKYPFACYATDGITSDFLYPIIWKAVRVLEVHVGLKVLFVTCDGASQNRKFFSMHRTGEVTHYTVNVYAPDRNIYFISDAPHLLKTARNCFSNSESHSLSRKLWNNGKSISWMHVVDLYNDHVKNSVLTHCPRLTQRHIDLDSHCKMNVSLAAQVLSSTVAHALEHLYDDHVSETVRFIRKMDKFFDCVNTKNLYEGCHKRNPNLNPYTSVDDDRLDWLQNDFLKYFQDWDESVEQRVGQFADREKQQMKLSRQTLEGLKITVNSIVEMVKFLLSEGVPFVLTNVFNQDPLEQQFGHCRHIGGSQDNPRVYDVRHSINRLRVMGSTALAVRGGNTTCKSKRHNVLKSIDNTPLKKRSKVKP